MNPINDISKRRYEKDTGTMIEYRKGSFSSNEIFKNPAEHAFFVFARKTEKVVAAIYLVTDVMDSELPLTKSLRAESLDLLNACYQVLTAPTLNPAEVRKLLIRLEQVTSLISIGRIAHHLSEMNAEVLLQELVRITDAVAVELVELSRQFSSYDYSRSDRDAGSQPVLSHQVLDDGVFEEVLKNRKRQNDIKTTLANNVVYEGIKKDIVLKPSLSKTTFQKQMNTRVSKGILPKQATSLPALSINSISRKQEILNVLKSHNNATMQDVQKFVTGCSEKTLQREMVSLIGAGLVRKEGDKRWATYHVS